MFKSSDGYVLCGSDYSAQEVRVCASMCGDEKMMQAYIDNKDLYCEIASLAFGVPYEDCLEHNKDGSINVEGKKRRSAAKAITLGVMYGKGISAIADDLQLSKQKAKEIYTAVMREFPKLEQFVEDCKNMARDLGYVTTVWGRKRRLPNINLPKYEFKMLSTGKNVYFDPLDMSDDSEPEIDEELVSYYTNKLDRAWGRQKQTIIDDAKKDGLDITDNSGYIAEAERQCVNARIQGTSADLTKQAMNLIHYDSRMNELGFRLLLPIHDEIIGEAPIENAKECGIRLAQLMIDAGKDLSVPLKTDAVWCERWYGDEYDESNVDELINKLLQEREKNQNA